jgi:hypothetical protein
MKSNNEEYLDSLLDSAQKLNSNNPKSALSRMSGRSTSGQESGDLGDLVSNSGGNKDLEEIGSVLDKLDRNEFVDQRMESLLDSIESPTDPRIPKFTIGDDPSSFDVRDPEEIALDEAIAAVENMEASGSSLVDLEDGDDFSLEMAPEVSLPEENGVLIDKEGGSDADESPEQILTDLLDDMNEGGFASSEDMPSGETLSDILDNMKDEETQSDEESSDDTPSAMDLASQQEQLEQLEEQDRLEMPETATENEPGLDDFSLDDLEKAMDGAIGGDTEDKVQDFDAEPAAQEADAGDAEMPEMSDISMLLDNAENISDPEEALSEEKGDQSEGESSEDTPLDDFAGFTFDGNAFEESDESSEASEEVSEPAFSAEEKESSSESLDSLGDEFNLDALEASLDDLLEPEISGETSTEGEVAAVEGLDEGVDQVQQSEAETADVSMEDLDALMDSLANDELEDMESTAGKDEESGHGQEAEIPKEDILGALTENGFGDEGFDGGEPSLEELASIPDRSASRGSSSKDEDSDNKGGKEKKKGFFARLFEALTKEDEEPENEGLASLTDENQQVLNELGEDGAKGKKAKKKKEKKEKPKKEKKPPKPKKEKKPKPPKPKKEKKPKPPEEPEKAISPKKIAVSGIFAASLGILVLIPALVMPDKIASERATTAYTHKEYTTAYKMLYGKEMTEDENIIYEQSRVLAWAQRYLDGYENYVAMNMKEEALDMLLMAMRNQEDLISEAVKYQVEIEVNSVYDSIESVLSENYGLSAEDIAEINAIKKDRDYTIRLMEIVGTL